MFFSALGPIRKIPSKICARNDFKTGLNFFYDVLRTKYKLADDSDVSEKKYDFFDEN